MTVDTAAAPARPADRASDGPAPGRDAFTYETRRLIADPAPLAVKGWTIKPYRIALDDPGEVEAVRAADMPALLDALLDAPADPDFHGPGFAVLHRARDGSYLLAGTWYQGHNLASVTRRVVETDAAPGFRLEAMPHGLLACIWEMAVYIHETQAWTRAVMASGKGPAGFDDYYACTTGGVI
ncbi:MAG: hypothetical protein RID91_11085 [Azospirillaceae bacterium]